MRNIQLSTEQLDHITDFLNAEVDDELGCSIKYNIATCECNYQDNEDLDDAVTTLIRENRKGYKLYQITNLFAWRSSPQKSRYWRNIENYLVFNPHVIPEKYRKKEAYPMKTRKINL